MSDYRVNIEDLFELAFGVSKASLKYRVDFPADTMGTVNFGNIPTADRMEANRMSSLGTPIMFPVKFEGGTYRIYNLKGEVDEKKFSDFFLPPTTLVDFSRASLVTKTHVVGGNGSVKEAKFFDDWRIRFRGVCLKSRQSTAQEEMNRIIEWFNIAEAIHVVGDQFDQKDIFTVVLTEIDIRANVGNSSAVPFEIIALSDKPITQNQKS